MNSLECLDGSLTHNHLRSPQEIREACREIRQSWSPEERARRRRLAETKQVGLLLTCTDLSHCFRTVAAG